MSCSAGMYTSGLRAKVEDIGRELKEVAADTGALSRDFAAAQRQQADMLATQEKLIKAVMALTEQVQEIHRELFPKTTETKPALKPPAVRGGPQ